MILAIGNSSNGKIGLMASQAPTGARSSSHGLWPREHGAWAMVLTPFAAACVVTRAWTWLYLPALVCVVALFGLREPLVILARQAWVWRTPHPESVTARRGAILMTGLAAGAGSVLFWARPAWAWILLGGLTIVLTALAVWMTVRNLRRAVWLQVVSAAALTASCLVASLCASGRIAAWAWVLWVLLALHSIAGVMIVRTRLDLRMRLEKSAYSTPSWIVVILEGVVATLFAALGPKLLAIAMGLSSAVHAAELSVLRRPASLRTPLRRIGFRTMFVTFGYSALVAAGLW